MKCIVRLLHRHRPITLVIVKTTADFSAFHVNGTVFPFSVIVAGRAEAHEKNRTLSDRLEGLSQRLKLRNILTFQFRPNLFKPFDIRPRYILSHNEDTLPRAQ